MKIKQISEEVFYGDEQIVSVTQQDINFLKKKALQNKRKRSRLCAHQDISDLLHDMLIVHTNDTYVPPHKHVNKTESFHVIEGDLKMILFDEAGKITNVIIMGDYSSGKVFYYRIPEKIYHTLVVTSDIVVFHETTNGPFNRESTIFPLWSPDADDNKDVKEFTVLLSQKVDRFLS